VNLEETPGLTDAERAAVTAYEEAHRSYAASVMGEFFDAVTRAEHEAAEDVDRAIERVEETYSRLSELAPSRTPGREGGMGYGELLSLLQRLGIGDRDVAKLDDPPVPWKQLPDARLLAFCCLDLMHYRFHTSGTLDRAAGRSSKMRLYDVPETLRAEMAEEQIAGAHGDRSELEMRLHMLLERSVDDGPEGRRARLEHLGYDCGYDFRLFISLYEDEPDYLEGFVEGCLERMREEEDEGLTHPDDVTADQLLGIWQDPIMPAEEKREMVVECLKADCTVREDTGDFWRL
jgi:hypothetical protein